MAILLAFRPEADTGLQARQVVPERATRTSGTMRNCYALSANLFFRSLIPLAQLQNGSHLLTAGELGSQLRPFERKASVTGSSILFSVGEARIIDELEAERSQSNVARETFHAGKPSPWL